MEALKIFSIAEVFTGAALILASVSLGMKVKENITDDLRKEWVYTLSLLVFCFVCYVFLALILMGNISYPIEDVAGGMFLAVACAVYIGIVLIKTSIQKVTDKDRDIKEYAEKLRDRTAQLEDDIAERQRVECELHKKLGEVGRLNNLMVGRELKMDELREEIRRLKSDIEAAA